VTITSATANYGLSALSTPTGTNIANDVRIGSPPGSIAFADADIVYSFVVEGTGASQVATLTLSSGAVAQTTGAPSITDGDGKDWEGVTLPTMVNLYAIYYSQGDFSTDIASDLVGLSDFNIPSGAMAMQVFPTGIAVTTKEITFSPLNVSAATTTVTIIGKSS
jgi:hypothetical protein